MGFYYSDEELAHHGIKGQRWGVRRFQNRDGTRTEAGKARAKETSDQTEKKGLTDQQKTYLKRAAQITATLAIAYGTYKVASVAVPVAKQKVSDLVYLNKNKSLSDLADNIGDLPSDSLSGIKQLSPDRIPKSVSDAFKDLSNNPLKKEHPNTCTNVFLAFEGRSRGLAVKPGFQRDENGEFHGLKFVDVCNCFKEKVDSNGNSCFKERKVIDKGSVDKALSIFPDGSRGYLSSVYDVGGKDFSHAISWSKDDGKINYGDGINGLNAEKMLQDHLKPGFIQYFRSDNLELNNDEYLKRIRPE